MEYWLRGIFGIFLGLVLCHLYEYGLGDWESYAVTLGCVFILMLPFSVLIDALSRLD